jgi:hypothetical protein
MNTSITSGQILQAGNIVADAGRKATEALLTGINKNGQGKSFDTQRLLAAGGRLKVAIAEVVRTQILAIAMGVTGCLKLLSADKKVVIKTTTGKRTIAGAKKTFPGGINENFKNYGCDIAGEVKPETATEVYEMTEDARFANIFGSFGLNLDQLCFTQDQIIEFVETQSDWLRKEGYATFFLFKVGNEFFVAGVRFIDDGQLEVYVNRFSRGYVWLAENRRRVVVPQLNQ